MGLDLLRLWQVGLYSARALQLRSTVQYAGLRGHGSRGLPRQAPGHSSRPTGHCGPATCSEHQHGQTSTDSAGTTRQRRNCPRRGCWKPRGGCSGSHCHSTELSRDPSHGSRWPPSASSGSRCKAKELCCRSCSKGPCCGAGGNAVECSAIWSSEAYQGSGR